MVRRTYMGKGIEVRNTKKGESFHKLSLGWDAASEHESGIKVLRTKFEIKSLALPNHDASNFRITRIPHGFHMGFHPYGGNYVTTLSREDADRFLSRYTISDSLECFWDQSQFLIVARMDAKWERAILNQVYAAICGLNAAIYLQPDLLGRSLTIEAL